MIAEHFKSRDISSQQKYKLKKQYNADHVKWRNTYGSRAC